MRKIIIRGTVAVATAVAVSALGIMGASASGVGGRVMHPVRTLSAGARVGTAVPGAQLWVKRYNGPANSFDNARSLAVSPDGESVFVTGDSSGTASGTDYATVAYNAATGAQRWVKRYNGPANKDDKALSVAASPDGKTVFVTGSTYGRGSVTNVNYATVAYNAATGAQLWAQFYVGPAKLDYALSVAASPDSKTVFVTGHSIGTGSGYDYATVAYNAATGAQLWVNRYNGPDNSTDNAYSVAVSPGGTTVYVTGDSYGATGIVESATVAYNAATGTQLWVNRYNGPGTSGTADSVAVSPDGESVFVTGSNSAGADYATVAYNAATGALLWVSRYRGSGNGSTAHSVAVSPDGENVFVTGDSPGTASGDDYATVAYNAATGAQLWVKRYNGPGNDWDSAQSVAVSPAGSTVYVTGFSFGTPSRPDTTSGFDYATVAYSAATGAQLWVKRYNGPGKDEDSAALVAVSPTGDSVFVTGYSTGTTTHTDYATIAYGG